MWKFLLCWLPSAILFVHHVFLVILSQLFCYFVKFRPPNLRFVFCIFLFLTLRFPCARKNLFRMSFTSSVKRFCLRFSPQSVNLCKAWEFIVKQLKGKLFWVVCSLIYWKFEYFRTFRFLCVSYFWNQRTTARNVWRCCPFMNFLRWVRINAKAKRRMWGKWRFSWCDLGHMHSSFVFGKYESFWVRIFFVYNRMLFRETHQTRTSKKWENL